MFCLKGKCVCVFASRRCECGTFSSRLSETKKSWTPSPSHVCGKQSLSQQLPPHNILPHVFFFSEGNPPVSLFNHFFFFLSDSFRFADFNPTSPFFFFFFLSVCFLITVASWFSLIHVWLQSKQKEALLKWAYFSCMIRVCLCVWACAGHSNSWQGSSCWAAVLQSWAMCWR